jgi:hypothetical protein
MAEDLITELNSGNPTRTIKTLQFLVTNLGYVDSNEIANSVKRLTNSSDVGERFWAKKVLNNIGSYNAKVANAQAAAIPKDLPVDILIQKLQSISSSFISLDVIMKLCQSQKPEALEFLKNYLANCKDNVQVSYLTKNLGIHFPEEEMLTFLIPFLRHDDERVVANTVEGIEACGSPKAVVVLSQLLEHRNNRVRTNAALALCKFDPEKTFSIISRMLAHDAAAHFKVSACHGITILKDDRYLELLEIALHDELVFADALKAIEAIGGKKAISLLADNYSQFSSEKQAQIDMVATKLSRLEESSLKKYGEKLLSTQTRAKANILVEDYQQKFHRDWNSVKSFFEATLFRLLHPFSILAIASIIVITFLFLPDKPGKNTPSARHVTNSENFSAAGKSSETPYQNKYSTPSTEPSIANKIPRQKVKPNKAPEHQYSNEDNRYSSKPVKETTTASAYKTKNDSQLTGVNSEPQNFPNVKDCLRSDGVLFDKNLSTDQKHLIFDRNFKNNNYIVNGKISDIGTYFGDYYVTIEACKDHYFDIYTAVPFDLLKYKKGEFRVFKGKWSRLGSGIVVHHRLENAVDITNGNPVNQIAQESFTKPQQSFEETKQNQLLHYPTEQRKVVELLCTSKSDYYNSTNELKKQKLKSELGKKLRKALSGKQKFTGWVGTLKNIDYSSADKGIVEISMETPDYSISIGTWNNFVSDALDNTLIPKEGRVFEALSNMEVGDRVKFSGSIVFDHNGEPRMTDFFRETRIIAKFSDIQKF